MTSYLIPVYATYLAVTVVLCTFLARSLYRNGSVFLADVFEDRPEMADSVNRLLVTGFAMLNVGYGFLIMRADWADDATAALEVLAGKLGVLLVSLAVVHFINLAVLHHLGERRRQREMVPPIAPQRWVTEPAEPVAF